MFFKGHCKYLASLLGGAVHVLHLTCYFVFSWANKMMMMMMIFHVFSARWKSTVSEWVQYQSRRSLTTTSSDCLMLCWEACDARSSRTLRRLRHSLLKLLKHFLKDHRLWKKSAKQMSSIWSLLRGRKRYLRNFSFMPLVQSLQCCWF